MAKRRRFYLVLFLSISFALLTAFLSFLFLPSYLSFFSLDPYERAILFKIRLPRIILAFGVGGSLSLSGVILQGIFRNMLVEPYTLGISGGASIGICMSIFFNLERIFGLYTFFISGFLGALCVLFLLIFVASKRFLLKEELLLSGVMISLISSSIIMLFFALFRSEEIHEIMLWLMGSLQESDMGLIKLMILSSFLCLLFSLFFSFDLNALSLGEEEAAHLGINIKRTKRTLLFLSSLLTGLSVSTTGIIGFVGLVVPHIMRLLFGQDHRILLFSSFFFGAAFLIGCDTLARTIIAPSELPVGVVTGIVGGGLFLYLLYRKKR